MQESLNKTFEKPAFKLYKFETSTEYEKIKSIYKDFPVKFFANFEISFFKSLYYQAAERIYQFVEDIEDASIKKRAIQLILELCKNPTLIKNANHFVSQVSKHYLMLLDTTAYNSSLELALDEQAMQPMLLAQGLSVKSIEDFYSVFHSRNFDCRK